MVGVCLLITGGESLTLAMSSSEFLITVICLAERCLLAFALTTFSFFLEVICSIAVFAKVDDLNMCRKGNQKRP